MKWSRGQITRMASSIYRRYEVKYSAWPYRLFKLCSAHCNQEERDSVSASVEAARACCLDSFTDGLRKRFGQNMLSIEAKLVIQNALDSLQMATDLSERQNAEINATKPSRSAARDFTHFARESVLKQARVDHRHRGGDEPCAPKDLTASIRPYTASISPLLKPMAL